MTVVPPWRETSRSFVSADGMTEANEAMPVHRLRRETDKLVSMKFEHHRNGFTHDDGRADRPTAGARPRSRDANTYTHVHGHVHVHGPSHHSAVGIPASP